MLVAISRNIEKNIAWLSFVHGLVEFLVSNISIPNPIFLWSPLNPGTNMVAATLPKEHCPQTWSPFWFGETVGFGKLLQPYLSKECFPKNAVKYVLLRKCHARNPCLYYSRFDFSFVRFYAAFIEWRLQHKTWRIMQWFMIWFERCLFAFVHVVCMH